MGTLAFDAEKCTLAMQPSATFNALIDERPASALDPPGANCQRIYSSIEENLRSSTSLGTNPRPSQRRLSTGTSMIPRVPAPERCVSYPGLRPDRVAMQDATAQMAILQFISRVCPRRPCPRPSIATTSSPPRLATLRTSATQRQRTRRCTTFVITATSLAWDTGIPARVLFIRRCENYAFPGGLMIGTDPIPPTCGGLGMRAGECADAVDVMASLPWELKAPKVIGVNLKGTLTNWTAPKDTSRGCRHSDRLGRHRRHHEYFVRV